MKNDLVMKNNKINNKEIKERALEIANKFQPEKIILFGSYTTGHPTPNNDVDLLIILDTERST